MTGTAGEIRVLDCLGQIDALPPSAYCRDKNRFDLERQTLGPTDPPLARVSIAPIMC